MGRKKKVVDELDVGGRPRWYGEATKPVGASLPISLVEFLDRRAKQIETTRSAIIKKAVAGYCRQLGWEDKE